MRFFLFVLLRRVPLCCGVESCCHVHMRLYQDMYRYTTLSLVFAVLFFIIGRKQSVMMMMMFVFGINVESDLESFTENKIFYILNKQ